MRVIKLILFFVVIWPSLAWPAISWAQEDMLSVESEISTEQLLMDEAEGEDLGEGEILNLPVLANNESDGRDLSRLRPWNILAWGVRYALNAGVTSETLVFVLLLPALATLVTLCRYVIGLPTLGMILPLALAATLLATGPLLGAGLLAAIMIGSIGGKYLLRHVRIMHFAKLSMSFLLVSFTVLGMITLGTLTIKSHAEELTFLPVLVLIILSERLTALGLNRTLSATLYIFLVNLGIALVGFVMLSSGQVQRMVLLYPELILGLIPINVILGRYFGLRLTELLRFKTLITPYAGK